MWLAVLIIVSAFVWLILCLCKAAARASRAEERMVDPFTTNPEKVRC